MLVNVVQVEDLVLIRGLVFAWKVVDDNDDVEDDVVVPFVFLSGTVMIKSEVFFSDLESHVSMQV